MTLPVAKNAVAQNEAFLREGARGDSREVVAMYGGADSVPENSGGEPFPLPFGYGVRRGLIEPDEFGIEGSSEIARRGGFFFHNAREAFRLHFADEVRLSAQKARE